VEKVDTKVKKESKKQSNEEHMEAEEEKLVVKAMKGECCSGAKGVRLGPYTTPSRAHFCDTCGIKLADPESGVSPEAFYICIPCGLDFCPRCFQGEAGRESS